MILGRGEEKTGGRRKQALLADTCEALFAAIYLDGGLEPARQFILRELGDAVEQAGQPNYFGRDHKSRLQEAMQQRGRPLPNYRVSAEVGPEHRKMFHVEVRVAGEPIAQGVGRTKKEAEQEAARTALEALKNPGELRTKDEERRAEQRTENEERNRGNEERNENWSAERTDSENRDVKDDRPRKQGAGPASDTFE